MLSVVGSGPGATAARATLSETGRELATGLDALERATCAVVVADAGDELFERANDRARTGATPWFAVELGGVGGERVAEAAVTGFGPDRGCYGCLRTRVRANRDESPRHAGGSETADGTSGAAGGGTEVDPATARLAGAVAGHEVTRQLAGEDALGRVVVAPYTEHPFLPVPGCDCGSAPDRSVPREHVDRSVEDSLARAERALDDLVGLVQEVGEAESFPVPYYLARLSDTAGFSDATAARDAAGVDPDWNGAFMKALGESLERYCAGVYRADGLATRPPDALENAVDPGTFVCKEQPAGESIRWVTGMDLSTGETVALPAAFVYHPPPERRYRPPITTGLGLGNAGVEALLSGLYETIERDAAMLSWYSSFDPLELAVDTDAIETMRSRAASERLDVTLLVVTMDVDVPVVAAAVHRDEWPRLAVGTAANLDAAAAAESALAEALQNWMELRGMGPDRAERASGAIGAYADRPEPATEFVDADATVDAADISTDVGGTAELDAVLDRLGEAGLDAYAARTTTRDVEMLGFEAVRVLVPAAQPLAFGEMYFGERARRGPASLGFEPRLDREHHPFP